MATWLALLLSLTPGYLTGTFGQQGDPAATEQIVMTAKLLGERKAGVELPVQGKVSRKIEMTDETFALPDGQSRAVLFTLPDYQGPYELSIKSFLYKRAFSRTEKIFVPTVVVFNGNYRITRVVNEPQLKANTEGLVKGPNYQAVIPIAEGQRDERFVLVFTNGDAVGSALKVINQRIGLRAQRSADGELEAETKPGK